MTLLSLLRRRLMPLQHRQRYTIEGKAISTFVKGINTVKDANGKVKKVFKK